MLQLTKHGRAQGCCVVLCLCGPNVRPNVFSVDYQSVLGVLGTRGDGLMRMEAKALHFDRSRRCPAADSSVDITGPDGPQREMTWVDVVWMRYRYIAGTASTASRRTASRRTAVLQNIESLVIGHGCCQAAGRSSAASVVALAHKGVYGELVPGAWSW